jgi:membrane protease YdiL (CAAX protease family)
MSILLDPPNLTRRTTPGKAAMLVVTGALLILGLSSFAAARMLPQVPLEDPSWWQTVLPDTGPIAAFRRILLVMTLLVGFPIVKRIGWSGLRDVGWTSRQTRGERKRDFLVWSVTGLLVGLAAGSLLVFTGQAVWVSRSVSGWLRWGGIDLLTFGLLSVVFHETLARGILYRSCADQWSCWPAAVTVSLLLAWFRFPADAALPFEQGAASVMTAVLLFPFSGGSRLLLFLCSFVFGLILCRFVYHKGDIWGAVGLHAFLWGGLELFARPGGVAEETAGSGGRGFVALSASTLWFLTGLVLFWGWMEWRHRKKLTSYGRVHF